VATDDSSWGLQGLLLLRDLSRKPEVILFGNAFVAKKSSEMTTPKSGMSPSDYLRSYTAYALDPIRMPILAAGLASQFWLG
jgi:hypothetical protein